MIELTRGDTKNIIVKRINKSTGDVIKEKPDKMYFTVKYDYNIKEPLFQKQLNDGIDFNESDYTYTITILPKDTKNLPYGTLLFDIEIIKDKNVITIYKGQIELTGEVTFDCNEIDIEEVDYVNVINKPQINGVTLEGNKTGEELSLVSQSDIADFIKKDTSDLENYTTTTDLERDYAKKSEIPETSEFITKDVGDLTNYTTTESLNQEYAKKNELPSTDGFIKKDVAELDNFYDKTQIDDKIDEETSDLLQGLSRELKPDEEDGGFSSQTTVSVKNKSGATEMIMEIDNLDITTDVPTNSVLGTLKGQDLEDRVKAIENDYITTEKLNQAITGALEGEY